MSEIRINIDDREIITSTDKNILQAAEENGIKIPHLCYDERIEAYGGCGLCVVEVEGIPKLQRACATPVKEGMVVRTKTQRTIGARKTALSLLVSDHRGDCRPPCVLACPAHTDCQGYVGLLANGQYEEAIKLVKEKIPMPASIGRVCPHPCETACRRTHVEESIAIADIKRYLGDLDINSGTLVPPIKKSTGKKVAVIGAGPSGIACAYYLAVEGNSVEIYEAMPGAGGMLRYGIPEYRLPKDILDAEINTLKKMGIKFNFNIKLGEDISLEYLKNKFDVVYLALGAWKSQSMRCKGEDMEGVMGGIEFLRDVNSYKPVYVGDNVIVIGGGNTAMDVARTAIRLGAKSVKVIYRRTREEMPAEDIEITEAEEEGVEFNYLLAPTEITGDGQRADKIICQKMALGEPDESGRRKPVPIPGEMVEFEASLIISAIGQKVDIENIDGIEKSKKGTAVVDEATFMTNIQGVFAGGEVVTGPKIAIEAIAQGKNAADVINSYLQGEIKPHYERKYITQDDLKDEDFKDKEKQPRVKTKVVEPNERRMSFRPISKTITQEEAVKEASRCLECGCGDYYECSLIKYIHEYEIDTEKTFGEKHKRNVKETHPFIKRNPDKCVLCGLCVRACDEIMGITALGLEGRGFNSQVKPEFGLPLEESACISCGQCADICPTGACMEIPYAKKSVPLDLDKVHGICTGCSTGCSLYYETKGNEVFRIVPDMNKDYGILCGRGKFGAGYSIIKDRVIKPYIQDNGKKLQVEYKDALALLVKKLQMVHGKYGKDSIGIIVSPSFTNEEAYMIKSIADLLQTKYVGSMTMEEYSPLKEAFGYDASTNSLDEINNTNLILSIGQVAENHPVLGVEIKTACKKADVISISSSFTRLSEFADYSLTVENNINFLKGMIKALFEMGYVNENEVSKNSNGVETIKEYIKNSSVTEEIKHAAKMYGDAKKAMIVIDEDTVTNDAIKLISDIAIITGKVGKPGRGIIISRHKNNSQGFIDMGIKYPGNEILNLVNKGKIKALIVIGENIDKSIVNNDLIKKLEYIASFDIKENELSTLSDIFVPLALKVESNGSYTRTDRKIQMTYGAVKPLNELTNFDILLSISKALGLKALDIEDIRNLISRDIKEYSGLRKINNEDLNAFWPNTGENPVGKQSLYSDGFATGDRMAAILIPEKNEIFKDKKSYDTEDILFKEFIKSSNIKY